MTQIVAMMNIAAFNEDEALFNLCLERLEARTPSYFYLAWDGGVPRIDVYSQNTERYAAVMELMAAQLLTGTMQGTCANDITTTDIYDTWEVGYSHYHNRMGNDLPNTKKLIQTRVRAHGDPEWNIFHQTLTHAGEARGSVRRD